LFYQYHPSGQDFVTASEDKTARLWDFRSDQQLTTFKPPSSNPGFTSCGLSLSGRFIFCGSDDNSIHIWDTLKNQHNGEFIYHQENCYYEIMSVKDFFISPFKVSYLVMRIEWHHFVSLVMEWQWPAAPGIRMSEFGCEYIQHLIHLRAVWSNWWENTGRDILSQIYWLYKSLSILLARNLRNNLTNSSNELLLRVTLV